MPADKLRVVARRLFNECCARLGPQSDPSVQCHSLETLSGLFLRPRLQASPLLCARSSARAASPRHHRLAARGTFRDFGADVLNLLSSIEEADAQFGALVADLKRLLGAEPANRLAPALQRTVLRPALRGKRRREPRPEHPARVCLGRRGAAAPPAAAAGGRRRGRGRRRRAAARPPRGRGTAARHSVARRAPRAPPRAPPRAAPTRAPPALHPPLGGRRCASAPAPRQVRVTVLLGSYQYENRNGFRKLVGAEAVEQPATLTALAQASRRVLTRALYPEGGGTAAAYLGAGLSHSLLRMTSWAAHALTLEDYMPASLSRQLSGPQTVAGHASALGGAMLLFWELIAPARRRGLRRGLRGGGWPRRAPSCSASCSRSPRSSRAACATPCPRRCCASRCCSPRCSPRAPRPRRCSCRSTWAAGCRSGASRSDGCRRPHSPRRSRCAPAGRDVPWRPRTPEPPCHRGPSRLSVARHAPGAPQISLA